MAEPMIRASQCGGRTETVDAQLIGKCEAELCQPLSGIMELSMATIPVTRVGTPRGAPGDWVSTSTSVLDLALEMHVPVECARLRCNLSPNQVYSASSEVYTDLI